MIAGLRRKEMRLFGAALLAATVCAAAVGCVQGISVSRAVLYDDIDSLARDSSAIVVGSVVDQGQDADATVSTVEVTNVPDNPELGANLEVAPAPPAVGESIEVREMSGVGILHAGQEYLLFLTPTMLPGDEAAQFYITGAVAGAYERDDDVFRRVVTDTGDSLPETIEIASGDG